MQAVSHRHRWTFILAALPLVLFGFWILTCVRVTVNGSHSLPHNGYAQWVWPRALWRGAFVTLPAPAALQDRFAGYWFVKRIEGLPGDRIESDGRRVCVARRDGSRHCVDLQMKDGRLVGKPIASGIIPPGHIAAFGESHDSLDSRYAAIGLWRIDQIAAAGVPLAMPHWKEIRAWFR